MKACPHCDEEIEDDAIKCSYCAEVVSQPSTRPASEREPSLASTNRRRPRFLVLTVITVAVLGLGIGGAVFAYTQGKAAGYRTGATDGYAAGEEAGLARGHASGYAEGENDGYNDGYSAGKVTGYNNGYDDGKNDGFKAGYKAGTGGGYRGMNRSCGSGTW